MWYSTLILRIYAKMLRRYAVYYFQHPTKIRGGPTYRSLKKLQNELHPNTRSADLDLGGGDHSYLGFILDNVEYQRVSGGVAFTTPVYTSALNVNATATAFEAVYVGLYDNSPKKSIVKECNYDVVSSQPPKRKITWAEIVMKSEKKGK